MEKVLNNICQCGCGGLTEIASENRKDLSWVKGEPKPFISRHGARRFSPWNKGLRYTTNRHHTLEAREKISKGNIKAWINREKTSWNKGLKLTTEHKQKLSEAKLKNPVRYWKGRHTVTVGANHWHWQGGKTTEHEKLRKSIKYKNWRTAVFERDDYTCQMCGKRGGKLNADHIKPFSLYPEFRFELSNGRALCVACHKTTDSYLNSYGRNQFNI